MVGQIDSFLIIVFGFDLIVERIGVHFTQQIKTLGHEEGIFGLVKRRRGLVQFFLSLAQDIASLFFFVLFVQLDPVAK